MQITFEVALISSGSSLMLVYSSAEFCANGLVNKQSPSSPSFIYCEALTLLIYVAFRAFVWVMCWRQIFKGRLLSPA